MSEQPFNEPRLALNRIYTRGGDRGETSLVGGQRVPKDSLRIECYGTADELNALIGLARTTLDESGSRFPALVELSIILRRVQHELFNMGSILATRHEDVHPRQPRVTAREVSQLETEIDRFNEALPKLRSFVLPGGSRAEAELHVCRTVCRHVERLAVALGRVEVIPHETVEYLNRLSDALFVWSRWVNTVIGAEETLWQPNQAASGQTGA